MPSIDSLAMPVSLLKVGGFIAVLFTFGCAEELQGQDVNEAALGCQIDDDCYTNESCFLGQCIYSSTTTTDLFYIITPNPASQYVEAHISPEAVTHRGELAQLTLNKPRSFNYQVLGGDLERVSASIYVYSEQRPPGFELVHSETYLAERSAELNLLPGPYRIRFEPKQENTPGVDTRFTVKDSTEDKDFIFPNEFRKIAGKVYGLEKQPLANVEVRAISVSSRIPSTTAVTNETGEFKIDLPETLDAQFTLIARTLDADSVGWTYRQEIRIDPGENRSIDIHFPEPEVSGFVRTQLIVQAKSDGGTEEVGNARVIITAASDQAFGSFQIEAKTNTDGVVTLVEQGMRTSQLSLLPGTYDVEVIPPNGSRYGRKTTSISVGNSNKPNLTSTIEISKRVRVIGAVLSHDAQPIPNVSVVINYAGMNDAYPSPGATVTTDDFGQYEAWLDPGSYFLQTSPVDRITSLSHPTGYLFAEVANEIEWQLKPLVVSRGLRQKGVVRSEEGEPLSGAMVVPYLKHENTVIQLQNSTTDALGEFNIIVPSVY